ncbi:MAG: molecular chaperone TorD family protein [Gaiellales bacterium]
MTEHLAATIALRRLLALVLAPPATDAITEAAELAEALAERPSAPAAIAALAAELEVAELAALAAEHARLFEGDPVVPPYEGSYELDPFRQGRQIADIAGFYAAFGAAAHGLEIERADHAGTELEFLSYLALTRLTAADRHDEAGAEIALAAEERFLVEHAGRWLPLFFTRLTEESTHPVYTLLGAVGRDAIVAELTARGLTVEAVPTDRRPRSSVEEDDLTCPSVEDPAAAPEIAGRPS